MTPGLFILALSAIIAIAAIVHKYRRSPKPRCEGFEGPCHETEGLARRACRTQYPDRHMNVQPFLCEPCAVAYNDYWDEMWADYYSGRF